MGPLPLNYTAQAEKAVKEMVAFWRTNRLAGSGAKADILSWLLTSFADTTPFSLPDGGRLFNDGLKGLKGVPARPPYNRISLEYNVQGVPVVCLVREVPSASVIGVINDMPGSKSLPYALSDTLLLLFMFVKTERYGWLPRQCMRIVPADHWEHWKDKGNIESANVFYMEEEFGRMPPEEEADEIRRLKHGLIAYLEVCEALACKNVKAVTYQESCPSNQKRISSGKLPIYETKILALDCPASNYSRKPVENSGRASPAQHLRRGHIRRLPEGNVWVNSCVVGKDSDGVLAKNYKVRATSFYKNLLEAR